MSKKKKKKIFQDKSKGLNNFLFGLKPFNKKSIQMRYCYKQPLSKKISHTDVFEGFSESRPGY
jgi:hypothetical protein